MVGLVIVSHSHTLAQGVLELAKQMAPPTVQIAVAGGIHGESPGEFALGTDAMMVLDAIQQVFDPAGVLVLMDLGSAVLSAEMALDFLDEEMRPHVQLCEAPLVEGTLAAAVQAGLGSPLAVVAAEARSALLPKASQLGVASSETPTVATPPAPLPSEAATLRLTVHNRLGLHARPAALFVQTVGRFQSAVTVRNLSRGGPAVNARSINLVATQAIRQNNEIELIAQGADAEQALAAIQALAETNFGDDDSELAAIVPTPVSRPDMPPVVPAAVSADDKHRIIQGIAASPGVALGPVQHFKPPAPTVTRQAVTDPVAEWNRLHKAIEATRTRITTTRQRLAQGESGYAAAIFDAHLLFLDDPALLDPVQAAIGEQRINAEAAWQDTIDGMAHTYETLDDPYFRARAADVRDVGRQVLLALSGQASTTFTLDAPAVLIAEDLTPSDTANLDRHNVLAVCTALGGPTSHSAILARTLGLPAVVGLGPRILTLPANSRVVVDGDHGRVWPDPTDEQWDEFSVRRARWLAARADALAASRALTYTADGARVEVVANIGSLADAKRALEAGAEGVGLLRTEFLFLERSTAPSEEEQVALLAPIFEAMGSHPVVVRTLDVGGDKELAYVNLGHEDNPFLGARAIRLYRERPDLIEPQLRAILHAGAGHAVRIMFPMIATLEEVQFARELVRNTQAELVRANIAIPDDLQVGIMIEIPAAAVLADRLAETVDFFSIGTNDLTQYTMAAERGNPRVAHLSDALHPAILHLIADVIAAAHQHGRWVGVCGELAGDPAAIPILLGLGLDEFSMNTAAIPTAKQIIRAWHRTDAHALALDALSQTSAAAVRALVGSRG